MAVEWQSSGNRFLQAVVAGVYYVCNRCAVGHDLGVLRGTTVSTIKGRSDLAAEGVRRCLEQPLHTGLDASQCQANAMTMSFQTHASK